MRLLYAFILLMPLFLLSGCAEQQRHKQVQQVVPVPQIQYVEATLIEGKTTKQEVLDSLGMPDSISESSLSYIYSSNKNLHAKLRIIYKDGTIINVILGHRLQHSNVLIHFSGRYDNQGNHIPSNINTGIYIH